MRIPGRKRRGAAGGYGIVIVMVGVGIFAVLFAVLNFVAGQTTTLIASLPPAFASSYDSATNSGVDALLFPGLGIMVMFGGIIVLISMSQRKKNGEDYA